MGIRVPGGGQRVGRTALPSVRVSTRAPIEAFGGGQAEVTKAASQLASTVGELVDREVARADQVAINEASAQFKTNKNTIEAQAFNTRGKNAIGIVQPTLEEFDAAALDIESNLSSDRQVGAFREMVSRERVAFDGNLKLHESREFERHDAQTTEALILQNRRDAESSAGNEPAVILRIEENKRIIQERGERAGQSKEFIDQRIFQETEETWVEVLQKRIRSGDTDGVRDELKSDKFNDVLSSDSKKALRSEADQQDRSNTVEADRQRRETDRLKKEQDQKTQNEFLQQMSDNKLDMKKILDSNLPAFGSGSKNQFIKMMKSNNEDVLKKTDSGVFTELWDRIHLPEGDSNRLLDENELNNFIGKGLTVNNITTLRREMQGKGTIQGDINAKLKKVVTDAAKSAITKTNPLLGIRDPEGDENYVRFTNWFLSEYDSQIKAGKTPSQLLNPSSRDYLGRDIQSFVNTPQQVIKNLTKGLRAEEPPKKEKPKPSVPIDKRIEQLLRGEK